MNNIEAGLLNNIWFKLLSVIVHLNRNRASWKCICFATMLHTKQECASFSKVRF